MNLKDFTNENKVYTEIEDELRAWVEKTYKGLSIEFEPHLEIVKTRKRVRYTKKDEIKKIIEEINDKIEELLYARSEEIYIAERLERIWKRHPEFNIEVEKTEDIKKDPLFLCYLNELIIKPAKENSI